MIILGIDPGLNGALAQLDTVSGGVHVTDMPTLSLVRNHKNKRELDGAVVAPFIACAEPSHVFLERVGAMPGQGVSSVFSFGQTYGMIRGILHAYKLPYTLVAPQVWKKWLKVPASKDGARERASQLMPKSAYFWSRVKDDGRAEAALIAYYGMQTLPLHREEFL